MKQLREAIERTIRRRHAPGTSDYILRYMNEALDVLTPEQQRILLGRMRFLKLRELQPVFWHLVRADAEGRERIIRKIARGIYDLKELERSN